MRYDELSFTCGHFSRTRCIVGYDRPHRICGIRTNLQALALRLGNVKAYVWHNVRQKTYLLIRDCVAHLAQSAATDVVLVDACLGGSRMTRCRR
jgi:hypothetical protein